MNYNFTDSVRLALSLARDAAIELRHDYVGTEHILLGLLRAAEADASDAAMLALERLNVTHIRIREDVAVAVRKGRATIRLGELPYTSRAKKVLELALAGARELGDRSVGTEHLLLGIVREEKGIASVVLSRLGADGGAVLEAIRVERAGLPWAAKRTPASQSAVWFLEVDAASTTPIYEQIITRIEEAVATGRLKAGERLPPVRDLAEELGVAPGTVARAYGSLEQKGVLVTDGARGTHVGSPSRQTSSAADEATDALVGLLRPVAVAAFHMGAGAQQVRDALDDAMRDIFPAQ